MDFLMKLITFNWQHNLLCSSYLLPINTCVGIVCAPMKHFSQICLFGGSVNYFPAVMVTRR